MKISDLAKFIKKKMGYKEDNRSDDEIIASNYYECIKYLYKGKEKPIVYGYRNDFMIINNELCIIIDDPKRYDKDMKKYKNQELMGNSSLLILD